MYTDYFYEVKQLKKFWGNYNFRPGTKDDVLLVEKAKSSSFTSNTKIFAENYTPRHIGRYRGSFTTKKPDIRAKIGEKTTKNFFGFLRIFSSKWRIPGFTSRLRFRSTKSSQAAPADAVLFLKVLNAGSF